MTKTMEDMNEKRIEVKPNRLERRRQIAHVKRISKKIPSHIREPMIQDFKARIKP